MIKYITNSKLSSSVCLRKPEARRHCNVITATSSAKEGGREQQSSALTIQVWLQI